MVVGAFPALQAEALDKKVFALLRKLGLLEFELFLGVSDDFGEADARVSDFWDAEIFEGSDAGMEGVDGVLQFGETEDGGVILLGRQLLRLYHPLLLADKSVFNYYNNYQNQWW